MKGRWRLFRHEAGRAAGPPAWAYVAMFAASLAVGAWSRAEFGAVAVWLSNGIMAAALLQLHRKPALAVVLTCFVANMVSNVWRGDQGVWIWLNAVLNLGVAVLTAVLARRFCGAALDMRRPARLARFAFLATVPRLPPARPPTLDRAPYALQLGEDGDVEAVQGVATFALKRLPLRRNACTAFHRRFRLAMP